MTTSINMKLPIDIKNNISLYDLEIEFYYVITNGNNIQIDLNLKIFNENINTNIVTSVNGNTYGYKTITLTDLKYTNITNTSNVDCIFTFTIGSLDDISITAKRFELKPKNYLTLEYYNTYTNPEFLYSYNTSINGLLTNNDKDSVHIFLNDNFKNILVILNQNIPMNINWKSLNNIDMFGENYGLYTGKSSDNVYDIFPSDDIISNKYKPDDITAFNFIKSLNNLNDKGLFDINVNYHYIDVDSNYAKTQITQFNNSSFNTNLPNWVNKFPPFLLETNISEKLKINNNSYSVSAIGGPKTNIKDKFIIYDNNSPLSQSIINEPLSRTITPNNKINTKFVINHGENIKDYTTLNRFVGYYEPLTKNIPLYEPLYYWKDNDTFNQINGNYKFNDNLDEFATINELMYSKVNENEYILKLKDVNEPSIYPMIDEIGLSQTKRNIFTSSWDSNYFIRTLNNTTLFDYTNLIKTEDKTTIVSGQFKNIKINMSGYYYGINIYGLTKNPVKIPYTFDVVNLSDINQQFTYIIKYHSSNKSYIINTGITNIISINDNQSISILIDRPIEIKISSFYEEFTKWSVVFELYDSNGKLLDTNNSILLNIYNDIINFTLTDPYGDIGFYNSGITFNPYYVESFYNFNINLNETYDKLKNIKYIFNLKSLTIKQSSTLYNKLMNSNLLGNDVYDKLLSMSDDDAYNMINSYVNPSVDKFLTLRELTGFVTTTKKINFNNIQIPLAELEYNTNEKRVMIFESIHNYTTGTTTVLYKKGLIEVIHVDRIQQLPDLYWMPWSSDSIKLNISKGYYDLITNKYSGDIVNTGVKIGNKGGKFSGTIKVIFNFRENGVTILQKSITQQVIDLEYTPLIFDNVTLGPLNINNDPIITYNYKNYDIKVSTSYISNSYISQQINGYNP